MFVPTRLRQFPRFVSAVAQRSALLRRSGPAQGSITLCHFTCASYFKYLYCSLHSLQFAKGAVPLRVIVFCDRNELFSDGQREALVRLVPGLEVVAWDKSQGWGATQIASIWRAYAYVAARGGDDDYVARVDSDVFFFSPWIFDLVVKSDADLVGDGHYVGFEYCQGGIYFVRAQAVKAIDAYLKNRRMEELLKEARINVEDKAAYHLIRTTGHRALLTWFMMFPDEYRIAGGLTRYQRWKFACLHFVMRNKDKMLEAYRSELLDADERHSFNSALSIP